MTRFIVLILNVRITNIQRIDVTYHLYKLGFVGAYTKWDAYGEGFTSEFNSLPTSSTSIDDMTQPADTNNYRSMVMEEMNFDEEIAGVRNCFMGLEQEEPNLNASSFYGLLHDADAPLWEGCNNHTRLSAVSQLLNCMSDFHISHNCFRVVTCGMKFLRAWNEMLVKHKKSDIAYLHNLGPNWMKAETKKLGRPPNKIEVFRATHTKKGTDGVFIDGKSRRVDEDYVSAIVEKNGSNSEFTPIFDMDKWIEVSGGFNK
ncbi:hypothetical protein GH714_004520 [Hevea brasiliensis]|uniref:Uncharacterized protein n=1 Tax=Hevea brasiliensis TaxID=3981 RepID=A0A6A6NFP7_HEVBR|nr:hypothetical protein GH714_004520 [Hevea brasiliensis]